MSTPAERLAQYTAMETAIQAGQSVRWGDRTVTYADLAEVRKARAEAQREVDQQTRAASGAYGPRFMGPDFSQ